MHETSNQRTSPIDSRRPTLAAALIIAGALAIPAAGADAAAAIEPAAQLARPQVLSGAEIADVIVRVRGGTVCTGTPITGTTFVVTAAHCVLDRNGEVSRSTVLRNGVEYAAVLGLVDRGYHDSPGARLDAAVLVMDEVIPGPSARLGDVVPTQGSVILAGFQPLDTDGSLLRGTRADNRPRPKGASGGVVKIDTAAAGCIHLASDMQITATEVKLPCGLIPGASGGGLFYEAHGDAVLVGIISTVAADLTFNGVTPLAALQELLANPTEYTHELPNTDSTQSTATIVRL